MLIPSMRFLAIGLLSWSAAALATADEGADPAACETTEMSRSVRSDLIGVYRSRGLPDRYEENTSILDALTAQELNCYEAQQVRAFQIELQTNAPDPESRILARLQRVNVPAVIDADQHTTDVLALLKDLNHEQRFDDALSLAARELGRVEPDQSAEVLFHQAIALAAKGEYEQAQEIALAGADAITGDRKASHYAFPIALAQARGDQEATAALTSRVEAEFGAVEAPKELYGMPDDWLGQILTLHTDRRYTIRPLKAPSVMYPQRAAERGISGECEVEFDVDGEGKPINIVPDCTDVIFEREARRSIGTARFTPMVIDGEGRIYKGVIYPIEFSLGR